jgi:hypothetical protein
LWERLPAPRSEIIAPREIMISGRVREPFFSQRRPSTLVFAMLVKK